MFNQEVHVNSYYVGKRKPSAIQHTIFNGWPDSSNNDAIGGVNTPVKFDSSAPNFQLPIGKMAPFNSHQTLFKLKAFWALYLPSTVQYSDIFRSYWSQRLMWLINETVSFIGPKEINLKTNLNKIDFDIERKLNELVEFLYEWKCLKLKFYECVIDLSSEMAKNNYWSNEEVELIKDWINDLNQIGYKEPAIINYEHNSTNLIKEKCKIYFDKNKYSKVRFTPIFQKAKVMSFRNIIKEETINKLETFLALNKFCESFGYTLKNKDKYLKIPYSIKSNYTLLITFNLNIFPKNIPILIHFYKSYFRNIVFCGLNIIDLLNETRGLNREYFDSFTFIEFNSNNGYFHYYCMNKAIEMNYETEGILLASDDAPLKFWNLHKLDSTKIWYPLPLLATLELKKNAVSNFIWWSGNYPLLINLFKFLNDSNSGQNDQLSSKETFMVKDYLSILDSHRVNNSYVMIGGSDTFYLPRQKFEKFHFMSHHFRKQGIFLEIAVPTILLGLDSKNDSQIMNGIYRWGIPFGLDDYEKAECFGHPIKLSRIKNSKNGVNFCKSFIQEKINRII